MQVPTMDPATGQHRVEFGAVIYTESAEKAARFILTRQNPDGGFGSYEGQRGGLLLRVYNPSEMFGNCMIEYSYVECTAACMHSLHTALNRFPEIFNDQDRSEMEASIRRGEKLLQRICRGLDTMIGEAIPPPGDTDWRNAMRTNQHHGGLAARLGLALVVSALVFMLAFSRSLAATFRETGDPAYLK